MSEKPLARTNITENSNLLYVQPHPIANPRTTLTANDVSRMVRKSVREGEPVKGQSRIQYIPFERKITQYETRQTVERVPVRRKVIEYREERVIEEVPREVITTDYYAVESIKQYYKEIIPEKKIEMMPIERKVRRVEYVPVERQVVHYPEGEGDVKKKSRVALGSQGIDVRPDAEYRQIDPKLLYEYSVKEQTRAKPIGYVEDGNRRYLSTSPTLQPNYQQFSLNPTYYQTEIPSYQSPTRSSIQKTPPQSSPTFKPIQQIPTSPSIYHYSQY